MIPIIYDNPVLTGNGIGRLTDALSCVVKHEVNGMYELMMTYPVTGIHYDELKNGRIVFAIPDPRTSQQAFRIYRITKPLNGVVTVYARHLSYDMSGIAVLPFTADSLGSALAQATAQAVPSPCPFTLSSPRSVATGMKRAEPISLWQLLGGVAGSFLDVYGGEWDFDNYTATLRTALGEDRGVSVRYGKNLTKLEQDVTVEATWAAVLPYWYNEESGALVTLPAPVPIPGAFGSRILVLDFSGDFDEAPTTQELTLRAERYIEANKPGEPRLSLDVNFALLHQSGVYENFSLLESVGLGDTVHVSYEPMEIQATARAVMLEFDVLQERYENVTLGRVKQNMAKIVANTQAEIKKSVGEMKSILEREIEKSTDFIVHGGGYMRAIFNADMDWMEIVSLDDPDINRAQSVWRWNNGGFGHSNNGYNGPYTVAITQDGAIVADFITVGTLSADRIAAGSLSISKLDNAAQSSLVSSSSSKTQYYLSNSQSSATGGSWSDTVPVWSEGKYLWTRVSTTVVYLDGTTSTDTTTAVYDKALTTALVTASQAQSDAEGANAEEQLIYYATTAAASRPTAPSTWVTDTTGNNQTWTLKRPLYSDAYKALYVCTQRKTVGGTVSNSTVLVDDTLTVIDGGNIITGSITANKIDIADLFAQNITATNFNITGGSINITTSSETTDIIQLSGPNSTLTLRPGQVEVDGQNSRFRINWIGTWSLTHKTLNSGVQMNLLGIISLTDTAGKKGVLDASGLQFTDANSAVTAKFAAVPTETVLHAAHSGLTFSTDTIYLTSLGSFGFIQFELYISSGSAFQAGTLYTIATLPAGQRPPRDMLVIVPDISGTTSCMVGIRPSGEVVLYRWTTSSAWTNSWIRVVIPYRFA